MITFDINKDHKKLARAEIEAVTNTKTVIKNGKITADVEYDEKFNRLAFTKAIHTNKKIDINKINQFQKRRAHLLPEGHPGMTHPRVARAMVNLAQANEIFDPFCGAGGILIEAQLCGIKTAGSDIDQIMVNRTKINIDSLKLKAKVKKQDATMFKEEHEAIITDLPYGKVTKVNEGLEELYIKFLNNVKKNNIKKAVIGFPSTVDHKKILKEVKIKTKQEFTYYLHKTLSKVIVVIENAQHQA